MTAVKLAQGELDAGQVYPAACCSTLYLISSPKTSGRHNDNDQCRKTGLSEEEYRPNPYRPPHALG
ncbi:MAG: hypothetical protein WBM84_02865, partial [Sedimenticolaceae bacterium]